MGLGSLFLLLAVFIVVGVYLYAPFMSKPRKLSTDEMHKASALKAERDRVISSLQELDFDFKLGKIPEEDYPPQRAELLKKGAEILRQLDELESASPTRTAEARIEKAAAAKRADSASDGAGFSDDEIEAMLAARRKQHKSKPAGFCPKCGKPVLAADNFCPSCGKSLK
ncbi:MAG: zinc-ribbon domain-containing protein [Anaerolineales bacterium]|nr:zinc-ribbon domain-containing protein [Anaerolineales bacterium]